jgi:DNA polymerase III epsilon subunit-like protein
MGVLILGLVLFLGVHSVRIVANDWRTQVLAQRGEGAWKGLYSVLSVVGLVLVVWGYGLARQQPVVLWVPPVATTAHRRAADAGGVHPADGALRIAIIDFETTGISPAEGDRPTEVAIVLTENGAWWTASRA